MTTVESGLHKDSVLANVHAAISFEYADATAREAATGFTAGDVSKFARQLDDNSIWMLIDDSPVTWIAVGGVDTDALHLSDTGQIDGLAAETTPASGDWFLMEDGTTGVLKKVDSDDLPGGGGSSTYPATASFYPREATVNVGNVFTNTLNGSQPYYFYTYQNTGANNDEWEIKIFLAAGTYTIYEVGVDGPYRGIQDIYIDGSVVGSIDWYAAGVNYDITKSISSVVVATDGVHTFKSKINGKNASATTDYQLLLTKVWIK